MNKSTYFLKLQFNNTIRKFSAKNKNGKLIINSIIINNIILAAPIISFFIFKGELIKSKINPMLALTLIFNFYLIFLFFIVTKKIIANIFFSEDYEIYLGMPIKLRDILISKIIELKVGMIIDSLFVIFSAFIVFFFYNFKFSFYVFFLVSIFFTNLLFISYIYLGGVLFLKIKKKSIKVITLISITLIVFKTIKNFGIVKIINNIFLFNLVIKEMSIINFLKYILLVISISILIFILNFKIYKDIIFSNGSFLFKEKKLNKIEARNRSLIYSMVLKDLKKIKGNKNFNQGFFIGNCMMIFAFIVILSMIKELFISNGSIVTLILFINIIMPSIMVISTGLPQILFSLDGQDRNIIISMPINFKDLLISKLIVGVVVNSPSIIIVIITSFAIYSKTPMVLILAILSSILTYLSFILIALLEDIKNINFNWFNSKELIEDYNKAFKIIGISFVTTTVAYLLSVFFKGNYFFIMIPMISLLIIAINSYTKIKHSIKEIYFNS